MVKVQFAASVENNDTEETFSGWVDPTVNLFELRSTSDDVRTFEFDNMEDAMEFIEDAIGPLDKDDDSPDVFHAEDARRDVESGESWYYAAHVTEV